MRAVPTDTPRSDPGRPARRRSGLPIRLLALLVGLVLTAACAGWDGVIDPRMELAEGPALGAPYRVAQVRDLRSFRQGAAREWQHSLYRGDPEDGALTSRAIARRRTKNDWARMGNIWLPEGGSVAELVARAVTAGFRRAGLRTLEPDEARPGERAIQVDVERFWGRLQSTYRGVRVDTRIEIRVTAPGTRLGDGALVCATSLVGSAGPSAAVWRRTFEGGLEDLAQRVESAVASGPSGVCVRN